MLAAVQVSPQSKVSTLSSDSLALMASARLELQSMDPDQVGPLPDGAVCMWSMTALQHRLFPQSLPSPCTSRVCGSVALCYQLVSFD